MLSKLFGCTVVGTMLLSTSAMATVTITSTEGNFRVEGELQSFEDNLYLLQTDFGRLLIDAAIAVCEGEDCPEIVTEDYNFRIALAMGMRDDALPMILSSALTANGHSAKLETSEGRTVVNAVAADNRQLGAVTVERTEADAAFQALLNREVDVILTDRRATNDEVEAFITAGLGNPLDASNETIFAQDAIVLATSPSNPVRNITLEDAEGIFSGRIRNWSELGGPDRPIDVLMPKGPSSLVDGFERAVLYPFFSSFGGGIDRTNAQADVAGAIVENPGAIGIVSSAEIGGAEQMVLTRDCGLETMATPFNIRSEDYPLARRMYAYSMSNNKAVSDTLSFLTSPDGQATVDRFGYVSLSPDTSDLNGLGKQLAYSLVAPEAAESLSDLRRFTQEVIGATRLSTTFRFASGSSQLDNKARADVERLAELLSLPQYEGAEVLLVGFTDSIGANNVNAVLSERRAGQVLEEITQTAGSSIDPNRFRLMGFGETYPAACNSDQDGRDLNRRVEVWLR